MKSKLLAAALTAGLSIVGWSQSAHAVFINFDALTSTTDLSGTPPAGAVLTTDLAAMGISFGKAGVSAGVAVIQNGSSFSSPNFIAGLDAAGDITAFLSADIYWSFVTAGLAEATTDSLSFKIGDDGGDTDSWTISAFGIGNILLNTQLLSGASHQTYSLAMAGIHRIEVINTTGTNAGYGIDDIEFNTVAAAAATPAPEPSILALFGLGLVGLGFARRRKQTA